MKASKLWVITLENGDSFTVEADDKGGAINKAVTYRGRRHRVASVENVALMRAAQKYKKP